MNLVGGHLTSAAEKPLGPRQFYQAVFSSEFAVYVVRFDDQGVAWFEDANDAVSTMAGLPRAQIVGQRPIDCLPRDIGSCLETRLASCFASGERLNYERTVETPSGTVSFKTSLVPITGRHGKVEHVLGITRDISSEADLVKDAQQNADLLKRLGIALPSAIYLLNVRQNSIRFIGTASDPTRQEWRSKAERAGGEATAQFYHPDDLERAADHLRRLAKLADGEVATAEFRILAESGKYRPHLNRETVLSRTPTGRARRRAVRRAGRASTSRCRTRAL